VLGIGAVHLLGKQTRGRFQCDALHKHIGNVTIITVGAPFHRMLGRPLTIVISLPSYSSQHSMISYEIIAIPNPG
jgi:hypothetical protein